ncbi:hypothetical protein I4U23_029669 [Adineta vaga]|nr:hypothetical protein I4U23_029669 [Adineta vaga]
MFFLILVVSYFDLIYNLQCFDNCSMTYSMSQPFTIPADCRSISSNRCSVKILFWYDRQNYSVIFSGKTIPTNHLHHNRQVLMIETVKNSSFSYDIRHVCKKFDNCARHFAERKILEMMKRFYNISIMYSDLQLLLLDQSILSENLACFDMNDDIQQCTIPGLSGSCQIINDLIKHKFYRPLCLYNSRVSASVNIYDSKNFAMLTVKCNRMFCNGPVMVAAVKQVLQRHQIIDVNGRLTGNSLQIHLTHYLFLLMVFLSFQIGTNK